MQVERVLPLAKKLLVLPIDESHQDLWLWEHGERVMRLTQMIADLPEVQGRGADRTALAAAGLFHDAGWALELRQGRFGRCQLLTRPTNDMQRELGALMLQEEVGHLLPGASVRLAADAIRHCNDRRTNLLEARILAEAEALDEMSAVYVLRQFRQYQAEGRPLQQLVDTWRRHAEYQYWDVRLQTGFHWQTTRELARQRLASVDAFMSDLSRDLHGDDLSRLLAQPDAALLPGI